jgi:hypothetical protein
MYAFQFTLHTIITPPRCVKEVWFLFDSVRFSAEMEVLEVDKYKIKCPKVRRCIKCLEPLRCGRRSTDATLAEPSLLAGAGRSVSGQAGCNIIQIHITHGAWTVSGQAGCNIIQMTKHVTHGAWRSVLKSSQQDMFEVTHFNQWNNCVRLIIRLKKKKIHFT